MKRYGPHALVPDTLLSRERGGILLVAAMDCLVGVVASGLPCVASVHFCIYIESEFGKPMHDGRG